MFSNIHVLVRLTEHTCYRFTIRIPKFDNADDTFLECFCIVPMSISCARLRRAWFSRRVIRFGELRVVTGVDGHSIVKVRSATVARRNCDFEGGNVLFQFHSPPFVVIGRCIFVPYKIRVVVIGNISIIYMLWRCYSAATFQPTRGCRRLTRADVARVFGACSGVQRIPWVTSYTWL